MADFDPFDSPTSRDDLVEGRRYKSVVQETIFSLRPGDTVLVWTSVKDVSGKRLELIENKRGDLRGISEDGEDLILIPANYRPGVAWYNEGEPWLRTLDGYESRGEVEELEVVELGDWE